MHNDLSQLLIYENNFISQPRKAIYKKAYWIRNLRGEKEIITSQACGEVLQLKIQGRGFVRLLNPEGRDTKLE